MGVFSQQREAELVRFVCDVEAGLDVESGALEANCTTDGKNATAVLSIPYLFISSFWVLQLVCSRCLQWFGHSISRVASCSVRGNSGP